MLSAVYEKCLLVCSVDEYVNSCSVICLKGTLPACFIISFLANLPANLHQEIESQLMRSCSFCRKACYYGPSVRGSFIYHSSAQGCAMKSKLFGLPPRFVVGQPTFVLNVTVSQKNWNAPICQSLTKRSCSQLHNYTVTHHLIELNTLWWIIVPISSKSVDFYTVLILTRTRGSLQSRKCILK